MPFFKFGTCVALPKNAKNGSTGSVEAISPKCQSATVPPRGFFDAQNQSCPEEEEDERVSYNKVIDFTMGTTPLLHAYGIVSSRGRLFYSHP